MLERSGQLRRRESDRVEDDLYKTFSTPHCHHCLQSWDENELLLDSQRQLIYISPQAIDIIKQHPKLFTLSPGFRLLNPQHAAKLENFGTGKTHESEPLCLLLENDQEPQRILLSCHQLPKPSTSIPHAARYLLKLHYFCHFQSLKWQQFIRQYTLTRAEIRLCKSLVEGLTLTEYSAQWNITTGTARSQLHGVLGKTGTRRQADLLRVIYLFTQG
ncbi:helix-turn-helix transcriptional regulator [Methylomonas sp. CM2]|uniref:helix-turn-helix transcriptional regulator n=1 Tax=Methylomonas sp. CM2 TaxID=3417647 RepID=UPI003CE93FFE